jgi:hypothetical protein
MCLDDAGVIFNSVVSTTEIILHLMCGNMIMNGEWTRIWKQVVVACLKHLHGDSEKHQVSQ